MVKLRGTCPVCGHEWPLRRDGTVQTHHGYDGMPRRPGGNCCGSGEWPTHTGVPPDWIRISGIGSADLPPMVKVDLMTVAIMELGIAQGLTVIHGRERGARQYEQMGGCVRFTSAGEPCIPIQAHVRARR